MKHFVFSDIHGSGVELQHLLQKISPASDDQLVFVGDALDRAVHGHLVWDVIHKHNVIVLMGNHEYKMLSFLQGKRDFLPLHYFWCFNNLIEHGVDIVEFVDFLKNLPLLKLFNNEGKQFIVTHAGVDINNPTVENLSWNVYGHLSPDKKMPRPRPGDVEKYWWDDYKGSIPVYYGHLVTHDNLPRIRYDDFGNVNSVGIDTATCHGGPLTAICPETNEVFQYRSGKDHYGPLKKSLKENPIMLKSCITDFIRKQKQL